MAVESDPALKFITNNPLPSCSPLEMGAVVIKTDETRPDAVCLGGCRRTHPVPQPIALFFSLESSNVCLELQLEVFPPPSDRFNCF